MSIIITGFSDSDKVPGFVGQVQYGAGPINILTIPLILLIVGLKSTLAGSITTNSDIVPVVTNDDADTYCGAGGEAARMLYTSIAEAKGYDLRVTCPTDGGGAQATMTITVTGTATSAGTLRFWLDGQNVDVQVNSGDVQNTIAANISTTLAQFPRVSATSSTATNVATWTQKCRGLRGNRRIVYYDAQSIAPPAGVTVALAGGSTPTSSSLVVGIYFSGGTGTETMTTTLSNLFAGRYNRIAFANSDATTLAAILAQSQSKASPIEGRSEHYVVASNDTLVNTTSIAQTTLNEPRIQMCWLLESETHPSEIAAAMAAVRASTEQTQPNSAYDGYVFKTLMPQRFPSQFPTRTTQSSALNNSVTPFSTNANGKVVCIRAITTHSLNGTTPDYRTLDVADAVVPDLVRDVLRLYWTSSFVVDNPYVQPNPNPGDPPLPDGVATPNLWNSAVTKQLRDLQAQKILCQVNQNPPYSEYDAAANRIMSAVPAIPLPKNHQVGVLVKGMQVATS